MPTLGSGVNQIATLANGVGANVQDPATWLANTVRQLGFQDGILPAYIFNTPLRQATFIANVLGQFMADYSGNATNDDGNTANAEANLVAALSALMQPFGVYFITDTGSANALVGTSTPAPAAYASPSLIVFKKANAGNTAAMTATLWGLATVALTDNTGAALSSGALAANSFYMASFDGGGFRVMGGVSTYSSNSQLSLNSGDAIAVAVPSATVTITIASPGVVTWTANQLLAGMAVSFATTGALPTGITAGVAYYVVSPATNTFQIAATPGGTAINTSGSQSGVHTATGLGAAKANLRILTANHNNLPGSGDGWVRALAADGTSQYMLTSEMLSWLISQIVNHDGSLSGTGAVGNPLGVVQYGPGTGVGQFVEMVVAIAGSGIPSGGGFVLGNPYTGTAITTGVFPGTNGNYLASYPVNGTPSGGFVGWPVGATSQRGGAIGGGTTWALDAWFPLGQAAFNSYTTYMMRFVRTA